MKIGSAVLRVLHEDTKQAGLIANISDLYPGRTRFESWPGYQLSNMFFVVLLSRTKFQDNTLQNEAISAFFHILSNSFAVIQSLGCWQFIK
jgi:hypothetical protein